MAADDVTNLQKLHQLRQEMLAELGKVIVGQQTVLEQMLVALFAGGHCLLVGVPGLAKTLMVRTLAATLDLKFSRIQFTPDLMPSDITGTEVIQEDKLSGERNFRFLPGPVFSNIVLADEINRTPPKTQAALLEAMQEKQITVGGERHSLEPPFFVLATQNPVEQEGTYPLPEAQLDRFMFMISIDYPTEQDELDIVLRTTAEQQSELRPVIDGHTINQFSQLIRRIPIAEPTAREALRLARLTRPQTEQAPDFIREFVSWGAGPRASQYLVLAAKAHAALHGEPMVRSADLAAVTVPVLRHRIKLNFNADAEGITTDDIVARLVGYIDEKLGGSGDGQLSKVLRSRDDR